MGRSPFFPGLRGAGGDLDNAAGLHPGGPEGTAAGADVEGRAKGRITPMMRQNIGAIPVSDFQVVGGARRKPPRVELFSKDEKREIYRRWRCHAKTMWQLAYEKKVQVADIDEVIKSESHRELEQVRTEAFDLGRKSMMPNLAA